MSMKMVNQLLLVTALALSLPLRSIGLANPRSGKPKLAKQARGFQKPSPTAKVDPANAPLSPQPQDLPPAVQSFNLGGGHSVKLFVPADDQLSQAPGSDEDVAAQFKDQFYGAGDVVWPSSLALARLVANCPSFVQGRNVIEVGCGLGLVSAAALRAEPSSLCLSDLDENVLALAHRSCTELSDTTATPTASAGSAKTCAVQAINGLDWTNPSTWPSRGSEHSSSRTGTIAGEGGGFDVVLASDVLYSEVAVAPLAALIAHLLRPASVELANGLQAAEEDDEAEAKEVVGRALVVDPANRLHRDAFVDAARSHGLSAVPVPFPGDPDMVLINITPEES